MEADDRTKGDGFQTQNRKGFRAGQVRDDELLVAAFVINGRKEWYRQFFSETSVWSRAKCRKCRYKVVKFGNEWKRHVRCSSNTQVVTHSRMRTAGWRWMAKPTVVKNRTCGKKEITKGLREIEDVMNVDQDFKKCQKDGRGAYANGPEEEWRGASTMKTTKKRTQQLWSLED